jgi:LytS/YehU family sensor histidine kinase
VPNLILQPLVENAIRHGIGASAAAGEIEISAIRENGTLLLKVRDDGPGFAVTGSPLREGVGLSNTRARLAQLYGPSHEFEFTNGAEGGCQVSLRLPFEVECSDEPEEVDVD